jgi:hypothetical protein
MQGVGEGQEPGEPGRAADRGWDVGEHVSSPMIEKSVIDGLVGNPSETLNVELKRWIDPTQPAGIEKIVKGVLALRNRNGGFFVVGFDDGTLAPDVANEPQNSHLEIRL